MLAQGLVQHQLTLFTGNANPELARGVAYHLGLPLGKVQAGRFSDGEVMVEIQENVRGRDVFLIQSTCSPSNDSLMELLVMVDACRRSSAGRITAVIPYYGYARQDRRVRFSRVPITAKLVANLIVTSGVDRVLTVDLHADQIQAYFDIPVDNIYASPVLLKDIWERCYENKVVVSPDVGGVVRARAIAKQMDDTDLAIIDKRRPRPNEAQVMNIIGNVEGKTCLLIDDLVDTAGTLRMGAIALKEQGAAHVYAYCTHPVLSGAALNNINDPALDELIITDTIPLKPEHLGSGKIRQLSVAKTLAETIRRIAMDESVSSMYIEER